jgi:cytochrome P450
LRDVANTHTPDWDPLAPEILDDQQRAHDQMRDRCPVAWSDFLGWSLFKHEDVIAVARDPTSFSNRVSASPMPKPGSIPSIPLQLDPPEHTPYKRFLITYFSTKRMAEFEPTARRLAGSLLEAHLGSGGDAVSAFTDIHFCLGGRLARLELRVALEELMARTKRFRLAGPDTRRFRWPGNGPRSLPLHITLE